MQKRYAEKVRQRREKMAQAAAKQAAKIEEQKRQLRLKEAQKRKRMQKRKEALQRMQAASVAVQKIWRGKRQRTVLKKMKGAALRIQVRIRAWARRRQSKAAALRASFAKQRFREAAAARLLQKAYIGHRYKVARLSACVMLQRKVRKWRDNRVTFRIAKAIARTRRSVMARRIQRCWVAYHTLKKLKEYQKSVLEALERKKAAESAKRMDLRRDFQRRRHLLLNKLYRESAISLLERMMESRGVNLDMQFRVDGECYLLV